MNQSKNLLKQVKIINSFIIIKKSFPNALPLPPRDYSGKPQYAIMDPLKTAEIKQVQDTLDHPDQAMKNSKILGYGRRSEVRQSAIAKGALVVKRIFLGVSVNRTEASEHYWHTKVRSSAES